MGNHKNNFNHHDDLTYQMCYEHSLDGILLTIPNGNVLAANPAACEIFGMSEDEICASTRSMLFDPQHPNFEKFKVEREQTGAIRGDLSVLRKDGTRLIAEISNRIFTTDKGELRAIIIIRDKTEKILSEQKIWETEEKYKQIVELSQEGIWVIDENNKTTFVNDAMAAILGYQRGEMIGMELFDFMDESSRKISELNIQKRKDGIKEQHDFVFLKKDGTKVWVIISTTPIFKDGSYGGAMAMVTDITQRKLAEEKVIASEDRFRELVENNNDAILLLDKSMLTIYRSPATSRMMGFTDDERIGRSYLELAHPDDITEIKRFQQIVVNNPGRPIPIKVRAKHTDGHYLWLEGIATNLMHNKSVNAIVVNLRDISERKKAEDEVQQLNNRLRIAIEASSVCIWEWDVSTHELKWDSAMYRLYGLDPKVDTVNFNTWPTYVHPEDLQKVLDDSNEAEQGIRPLDTDFRIIRASDHAIRYIRSKALNVVDQKTGKVLKMIGSNWDITEQRRAKQEKEKILADLIRRNDDLEQFAYIISHNLRAPVTNVLSLSEMLINDDVDHESKPMVLNGLDLSVKKIDLIINDLNNIFQSRQRIGDKKETIYFQQLVDDIKFSINHMVEKENVLLNCDFGAVNQVFSVRSYLYSILYNLILNSIKYSREDFHPVINISTEVDGDKYIKLLVADNGKGIDLKRNEAMLFGLYQRFDQTVEGRGLGLYMVKTQVESLGGTIKVDSELDKGTVFTICIPV
ncbi:PAS domain S-box protein [Mucilaginibacter sp.]|uniref:PAS domain S-box protein n=1 Tax=Mucilaginibacter sp. TaxID=1882438 RepID=UPI003D0A7A98